MIFTQRQNAVLTIVFNGVEEDFGLLQSLEFTSERRRMSVFVKSLSSDRYFLFTKGADDMIFERSIKSSKNQLIRSETEAFSRQGLRTLLVARKEVLSRMAMPSLSLNHCFADFESQRL